LRSPARVREAAGDDKADAALIPNDILPFFNRRFDL
jgi:hypothetical protein